MVPGTRMSLHFGFSTITRIQAAVTLGSLSTFTYIVFAKHFYIFPVSPPSC